MLLLDGAIGSLLAAASGRIARGEASADDRQLLAFAGRFIDFKSALESVAPPTAAIGEALPAAAPLEEEVLPDELVDS